MFSEFSRRQQAHEFMDLLQAWDDMKSEEEKVNPDTFPCDALFIRGFISPEMEEDFPVIANAFLLNVPEAMDQSLRAYYTDMCVHNTHLRRSISVFLMEKILHMAKAGNEYSVQLIRHLYKTYYKKEYKVLKRFSHLSERDVMGFVKNDEERFTENYDDVSRVLTIAPFFGIAIDPDCSFIYSLLEHTNRVIESRENEYMDAPMISQEEREEIEKELMALFEVDDFRDVMRDADEFWDLFTYQSSVFDYLGYPIDFGEMQLGHAVNPNMFAMAAWLAKREHPKEALTKERVQIYASVYLGAVMLCNSSDEAEDYFQRMLGELDEYSIGESLFKPDEFERSSGLNLQKTGQKSLAPKSTKDEKKIEVLKQPIKADYDQQALLDEIDELRKKLHQADHDEKHLSELYAQMKQRAERAEASLIEYQSDREELITLREHVYNYTEEDIVLTEKSRQDYIDQLKDKKIVIIGGHTNWVRQLREIFPKWTYVNYKSTTTVDDSILTNADHVFFFTDMLKHHVYYRFINLVRERKIPFGYISSSNIDKGLKQMAEEILKG